MKTKNAINDVDVLHFSIWFDKNKLNKTDYECQGKMNEASKHLFKIFKKGGKSLAEDLLYDVDVEYQKTLKKNSNEINMFMGKRICVIISFDKGKCSAYWSNEFKSNSDMFDDLNVCSNFPLNIKKIIKTINQYE